MKTLCIVPCGARKIWADKPEAGPTQAKDVFTGPFARKCRAYAKRFYPGHWVILSAKYGFIRPEEVIPGPYNVSFNDINSNPIKVDALKDQARKKGLQDYERVVILGGRNYVRIAKEVFAGMEVRTPLEGCKGIGYMMQRMNEAIKKGESN